MRIFLYVLLFIAMSPGFFFHVAAPKGKTILFKSVIIHAFLFAIAAYLLKVLVQLYPQLDGFSSGGIIDTIRNRLQKVSENVKETVTRPFRKMPAVPSASGSLPAPMQPEKPMEKSIQHTRDHARVGASESME
jgi:hypothetical protein